MRLHRGQEVVLAISDLQEPYAHPDALEFAVAVRDAIQPTTVVCVGDEVDQHALSRFDHDPDAESAGPELRTAIAKLTGWYTEFPSVLVCTSNHTDRVYKKAFNAGIPEAYIRPINEWLEAPATWVWADKHLVDGVQYEHGDAQGGMYAARNLAIRNRRSTAIGHHHSHGGVYYISNDDQMIFGMNTGCLIDVQARAFAYGRKSAFKPTLGLGAVIYGVPYFIPMLLDTNGHWTGEVIL